MQNREARETDMRESSALLFIGVLGVLVLWATPATAGDDDPKWCRACHTETVFSAESFGRSAHGDLSCRDCHEGFHFNPHEEVTVPDESELKPFVARARKSPGALAACTTCHDEVTDTPGMVPHAMAPEAQHAEVGEDGPKVDTSLPYCLDCHGDAHAIPKPKTQSDREKRLAFNERCIGCHGNEERMSSKDYAVLPVETYELTVHGRKLGLGSVKAPGCIDCHGSHKRRNLRDEEVVVETCGKCHSGVTTAFAHLVSHRPVDAKQRPTAYYTQKFFAWLTFLTILFLMVHVALDLNATLRSRGRGGKE
ncbi:MAG: hypothetical protein AMXMBFR64_38750 [Myxococcales bacterium]